MTLTQMKTWRWLQARGAARARARVLETARDERGLSTVEYVILLALIAAVAIGTWNTFGGNVHEALTKANGDFEGTVLKK